MARAGSSDSVRAVEFVGPAVLMRSLVAGGAPVVMLETDTEQSFPVMPRVQSLLSAVQRLS
ncbi:hypothetical protein HGR_14194 [Hylemonella gracilis ATCC 19624]|uniref:Uncharacterized protein n=1 Tax=Hylemonella gracilis ATCC 19624 TaxID=887062 RepID=F3KWK0_9BURK|nr:hypothetical protein HGR_14194 [Hylemonella gracilis ATCC 19624]